MSVSIKRLITAAALLGATPALAQQTEPPKPVTITGSVAIVTDYRFRGVSQSDGDAALQGGATATHRGGGYVGVWGSNLAGWGTFGGANLELDLIGGYKLPLAGGALDVGITWYLYPGGAARTDFAEPYAKLSGTIGPAGLLAGIAYAPPQRALGRWYASGAEAATGIYTDPGDKKDNLYLWGDAAIGIPRTPVTVKAHVGHSNGNAGLGPNGTSIAPTGDYSDWLLGADLVLGPVTLGAAYVDTDIAERDAARLRPNFATSQGRSISGARLVVSAAASF
jgi:uncharacterized protein (TIGR02001 family)